jgi:pimeloyl-ACP methyl ester carboxylesterase
MVTILRVNGVELCVDTYGEPADPTILLVAGMASSMDWWEPEFCERLAAGPRFVVRYDLRDTGRSTTCPPGAPNYTFSDLIDDAVGLLDALGVERAHLAGISMGGALAQCVALRHPGRVASLTLMSTSPAVARPPGSPELSYDGGPAEPEPEAPDWSDSAAVVDYLVAAQRRLVPHGFDEARTRAIAEAVVARSLDVSAAANHSQIDEGPAVTGTLADIAAPTLVIHGTADPAFPIEHGAALAREIPAATLLELDGVGHEAPPPRTWDVVVPAILEHTAGE